MQVIVAGGLAKYIFEDTYTITRNTKNITTDFLDVPKIGDLNNSNSTIYTGVTNVPVDWCGDYYTYDGGTWTMTSLHPDFEKV